MKNWKLILSVLLLVVILVAACTPAATPTKAPEKPAEPTKAAEKPAEPTKAAEKPAEPTKVAEKPAEAPKAGEKIAALFMGPTTDQSWNQLGLEGIKKARTDCGIDYAFTESVKQTEFEETYRNYAQQGYKTIIGHSGTFTESAKKIAPEFPDTNFIVINAITGNGVNQSGIYSDYWQMGYLAGAAACQMTKTNKVAIVTAERFPMVEPSFESFGLGAKSCGKNVTAETVITGSFDDVNKAYEATTALANKGVDVVWHQLDSADVGVFSAAQDKGIFTIGLYNDQSSKSPKTVVASVFVSPSTQTYEAACGRVHKGQADMVNLKNGMQIVMTNLMSPDAQKAVNQTIEDLKSGKIKQPEKGAEAPKSGEKIAALFMGPTTDQSWNQLGLEGIKKAKTDCGIDYAFTESVKQTEFEETYRNYAQQGYKTIIGHSGTFTESAKKIAPEFPDTNFIVINAITGNGVNQSGIYSDYWQMGYLAGAAACQMTKTNKVAIVTAERFPMVEPSFESFGLGAKSCGKNVTAETVITGSFDDVNKAYEATTALANKGVDVVWHQLDSADVGVFSAAQDKGIFTIGLYNDQSSKSPKTVVASVFVSPSTQTYEAACGRVHKGQADMVNLNNGMQIVMTSLMSPDAEKAVNQTIEDLKSGKIKK